MGKKTLDYDNQIFVKVLDICDLWNVKKSDL